MSVKDFLQNRKTTREFKDKDLSVSMLKDIERGLNAVENNRHHDVSFDLVLDGDTMYKVLDGHAGYSGVMIKSPQYVVAVENSSGEYAGLKASYSIEDAITFLSSIGIGSCYVTVKDCPENVRKQAFGVNYDRVKYILAIGEAKTGFLNPEKPSNPRFSVSEIVFKDEPEKEIEDAELDNLGLSEVFYYARLAPSTMNLQPWRYLIKDSEVLLITKKADIKEFTYVDLGIAMYYFSKLAEYDNFKGEWKLVEKEEVIGDYKVIAKYKL